MAKAIKARDAEGTERIFIVGGSVGFKCDVEQYSTILDVRKAGSIPGLRYTSVDRAEVLVDVQEGGYGHGEQWIPCERCWEVEGIPAKEAAKRKCPHCGKANCPGRNGSPHYSNEDFDNCQAFNAKPVKPGPVADPKPSITEQAQQAAKKQTKCSRKMQAYARWDSNREVDLASLANELGVKLSSIKSWVASWKRGAGFPKR